MENDKNLAKAILEKQEPTKDDDVDIKKEGMRDCVSSLIEAIKASDTDKALEGLTDLLGLIK